MTENILHNDLAINENGQSHRTVRIAERAISDQLYEVVAFMNSYNVRIARMSDDTRAKSFQLSADEMDTLCGQWIKFREDCISSIEAEEKRVEAVKAEAFKLIEENALIKVSEETDRYIRSYWHVTIDEIYYSQDAYTPDQLLETLNSAIERYIEHTFHMSEVKELVKKHPEITVKNVAANSVCPHWNATIPSLGWEQSHYARTSHELLEQVKEAVQVLEAHKVETAAQDKRKTWWQDAMDLAQQYPAIRIQDRRDFGESGWNVTVPDIQFGKTAHSAEELFQVVQEASQKLPMF